MKALVNPIRQPNTVWFLVFACILLAAKPSSAFQEKPASSIPPNSKNFHLFVLAGQSNMAGRGKVAPKDTKVHPRVFSLSKSGSWEPAVDPLHFDKPKLVGVGLGRTFAIQYANEHPGVTVGLIPCAVGGSPISSWTPGGFHTQTKLHPYDDALARCKLAMQDGQIKGVLWHQGESDTKPKLSAAYADNLQAVIQKFRFDSNTSGVPWIIGQLGQFADKPWTEERRQVDRAHKQLVTRVPNTIFVASSGLEHKGDQTHFSAPYVREFGRRYYQAWRQWELGRPRLTLSPTDDNPRNSEGDFIGLSSGRILFVYSKFTGGSSDHASSELVSRYSDDGGNSWSQEDNMVLENEAQMNTMSVSLLRLSSSEIAMFYMRKNSLTDCRPFMRVSTDEGESWGPAQAIIPDSQVGYYVLNNDRVVRLSSGRIVVPVALHNVPEQDKPDWAGQITTWHSDNSGKSWIRSKTLQSLTDSDGKRIMLQEPGVIELAAGKLLCWVRTDAGYQYKSESEDAGESWSKFVPTDLASPRSPASIKRVPATEDLVAVWNDHGSVDLGDRKNRTPLSFAFSSDEGASWTRPIPLENDPSGWFCYTAIEFAGDAMLLGYCAGSQTPGKHLATTTLKRLPLGDLYRRAYQGRIRLHRRIWNAGTHNAFTDLCHFKDAWYCVFREGTGHVSPDGALRVLRSDDLVSWKSSALIESDLGDLRDAKLTITPDERLMLSGAAALPKAAEYRHQSLCWFSDDGVEWSEAAPIGQPNYWLWRTTWNKGIAYSVGYSTGADVARHTRLFTSRDATQFNVLVPELFTDGYANESSILFDADETAHCLLRRDGKQSTAQLGHAVPPYTNWTWTDLGVRFGGPHMIRLPDSRVFAAGRMYTSTNVDGKTVSDVRTSICRLNIKTGQLTEIVRLPSSGDTSYPGLVWHDDHLWVSYYSTHESGDIADNPDCHSAIYIAKIKL